MKKHFFLSLTLLTFAISFSQNVFPTAANTNVGIGTGATAPSTRLQLTSATAGTSGFRLTNLISTTAVTTGLLGKALSVDATGNVVLVPVANTSLFSADGALASARTVNMSAFNLTFNPSTANSQFFINGTTGNTGIGTITPATKLEVKSTTAGTSGFRLTNLLSSTAVTTGLLGKALSVNATGDVVLVPVANTDLFTTDGALSSARTLTLGGNNLTFNPSTASSQFFINGTTGNTGIGNVAPTAKLEVSSGTAGDSGVKLTNLTSTSTPATANGRALSVDTAGKVILVPTTSATTPTLYTDNGTLSGTGDRIVSLGGKNLSFNPTNNLPFLVNGANGNVGIGTATPTAKLDVFDGDVNLNNGKITVGTLFTTEAEGAARGWSFKGDRGIAIRAPLSSTAAVIQIENEGTNSSMQLAHAGGDGYFSSQAKKGDVVLRGMTSGSLILTNEGRVGSGVNDIKFVTQNNEPISQVRMRIDKLGNVGIGTGTLPITTKLEVTSGTAGDSGIKLTNLTNQDPTTLGNQTALGVDATGRVILVHALDRVDTPSTFYTDDGTLTGRGDRTVSMEGKNLSFNPTNDSSFNINGANGNVGIGTTANKGKLEIEGFPAINKTYTFLDYGDSFAKSCILNIGTLRENENPSTSPGARLLTFSDVPPSNITASSQTMLAIEDRNNANRLRHHALANGFSSFTLSDKTQSNVFSVYEDGTNAFFDLTKTGSYLTVGGKAVWPVEHNFWVKTGTSKFNNDVFVDTHVGIGTSKFLDITDNKDYKLSVKGRIRAEEVKVYNTWADYVFKKEYNLRSLNDLEAYIDANGHLPNVPSAKEVTEKGLELGEMTKIQQEKIEELTLYLIQQNKEIQELKAQMKALMQKK